MAAFMKLGVQIDHENILSTSTSSKIGIYHLKKATSYQGLPLTYLLKTPSKAVKIASKGKIINYY